jgi:hypothetical protein
MRIGQLEITEIRSWGAAARTVPEGHGCAESGAGARMSASRSGARERRPASGTPGSASTASCA